VNLSRRRNDTDIEFVTHPAHDHFSHAPTWGIFRARTQPKDKPPMPLRAGYSRLAAAAFVLLATSPAYALDGGAFGDRLKAFYAGEGAAIDWQSLDAQGSTVVLHGVNVSAKDVPQAFSLGDVTLDGVNEAPGGGYHIDKVSVPHYAVSKDDFTFSGTNLVIQGADIPGPNATDALPSQLAYDSMTLDRADFASKTVTVFEADGIHVAIDRKDPGRIAFSGNVDGFSSDLSKMQNEKAKATAASLGYEQIHGTAEAHGSWSLSEGHLVIDNYTIAVDKVGKLTFTSDINGYTPAFIKSMREIQASLKDQKGEARGLAMMGLLQQLEIGGISIRFDDASLTGKLLDFYAQQKHTTRAALVNQVKGALPVALAKLHDPDFAAEVTQAVGTFLDDPKSIEIKVAPAKPLPVAIIAATGMAQPQALPKTLGLNVTANQ
jgi:hypothetical protein